MAQPNVAREPSMEEILASIRRIIESNEPETASDELARLAAMEIAEPEIPGVEADDIRLTIEDELASFVPPRPAVAAAPAPQNQPVERPAPVSQVRPQPQPSSSMAPPVAANAAEMPAAPRREEEPRSISLADVAARVRAASERSEHVRPVTPAAEAPRPVEIKSQPVIRTVEPAARPEPVAAPEVMPAIDIEDGLEALALSSFEEPRQDIVAELPLGRHEEPSIDPAPEVAENRGSLVSRETGDQVARSFHELAEMVQMTAQRSLDDIAGEMLRPMLQEWLDDNLPTLVERLVREEIERVARGPRR